MSKRIERKDIAEEGVLNNLLDPLKSLIGSLDEADKKLQSFADTVKNSVKSADDAKGMRELEQATQGVNKAFNDKLEIDKQREKLAKDIEKAEAKLVLMQDEEYKQLQQLKKAQAEQNQSLKDGDDAYKKLSKSVRDAKNESKTLGAELLALEKSGQKNTEVYAKLAKQYEEVTRTAQQGDAELKSLDKTVGDNFRNVGNYESALSELNKTVAQGGMGYRDLRKMIKEYQDIAVKAGRTSPIGKQAIEDASKLQDELDTLSAQTKALADDGANMKAALQLGEVVASSYQSVLAVQQLLGVESERILEVMAKIQAVQVVINNLNKIRNSLDKASILTIKVKNVALRAQNFILGAQATATTAATVATRALNVAMRALPILAIIGAVTALISAFIRMSKEQEEAKKRAEEYAEAQKKIKEEQEKANKSVSEASGKFVGLITQLKATNENSEERLRLINEINDTYGLTLQNLSDEKEFQEQLNVVVGEYIQLQRNKFKQGKNQEEINKLLEDQLRIEQQIEKHNKEIDNIFESRQKRGDNITRGRVANDLNLAKVINQLEKEYEGVNKKLLELGVSTLELKEQQDELTDGGTKYEKLTKKTTGAIREKKEATDDLSKANRSFFDALESDRQRNLQDEEKELQDAANRYDNLVSLADVAGQDTSAITEQYQNDVTEINKKWQKIREDNIKKSFEELQAIQDEYWLRQQNAEEQEVVNRLQRLEQEIKKVEDLELVSQEEKNELIKKLTQESESDISLIREKFRTEREKKALQDEIDSLNRINNERELASLQAEMTQEEFNKAEKERQIKHIDEMIALLEEYGDKEDEILALKIQRANLSKKTNEEEIDSLKELKDVVFDYYDYVTNQAMQSYKNQEQAAAQMYGALAQMAATGNITAQESLAAQVKAQEEAQKAQMKIEQKKQKTQLISQGLSTFGSFLDAGDNPQVALGKTGVSMASLIGLINSLPSFFDGIEDTGKNGKGVDGKGGFVSILHPNERVMTAEQNAMTRGLSNPMLADVAWQYKTGNLVPKSYDGSFAVVSELVALRRAVEQQPKMITGLEQTLTGMVKLVVSEQKGNHKNTNIYKS